MISYGITTKGVTVDVEVSKVSNDFTNRSQEHVKSWDRGDKLKVGRAQKNLAKTTKH